MQHESTKVINLLAETAIAHDVFNLIQSHELSRSEQQWLVMPNFE